MTTAEQAPEAEEQPSKLAGGCVLVAAAAAAGGVVYAVPEVGYTVAGALVTIGVGKVRASLSRRRESDATEPDELDPVDIVAVLHHLGEGGQHVRLTQLQDATGLPDTKAVRALLDDAGVPVRAGVRAGRKNGPGVHHDDFPPLDRAPSGRCLCRSGANANANNGQGEGGGEGLRVEAIGQAGTVVHTPAEASRHHRITAAGR
ncbi:hypothetical protein [Streptomyces sp. NPDC048338]|uniref:hypothetical protein n=1 Tax=Streptomyces sp. NPDC048338 TaxID=3365536 RepID=UPI0037202C75